MSLGSMFSSPGKQASQAAQGTEGAMMPVLQELQQYTSGEQEKQRGAVENMQPNPYFHAAQQLNPQAYYTNPNGTATFNATGSPANGLTPGNTSVTPTGGPPPPPGVILPAPTSGPAPVAQPPVSGPPLPPRPIPPPGPPVGIRPPRVPLTGDIPMRELM